MILLEMVWLLMMLAAAILLSQLMGEGIFALCRYLTGMPWQPFGGFGISLIAILTTVVVLMVYTRKSILPLADATYSERHTGKVLVAMEVGENFAYTFGKLAQIQQSQPAFWAGLADIAGLCVAAVWFCRVGAGKLSPECAEESAQHRGFRLYRGGEIYLSVR